MHLSGVHLAVLLAAPHIFQPARGGGQMCTASITVARAENVYINIKTVLNAMYPPSLAYAEVMLGIDA